MIDRVAAITPQWLSAVLSQALALPQLRVAAVRSAPLALNAAYCAQLFRVRVEYTVGAAGAPRTLIAKLPGGDPGLAENARVFQPGTKEAWFYANAAPACDVDVPRCFYSAADRATGKACFLLEDLGELEATSQTVGMTESDAALALVAAAQLHARWWNASGAPALTGLRALIGDPQAAVNLVDALYADAWPLFVKNARFELPPAVRAFGETLIGQGARIAALCQACPQTLIHGDFRVDNLLFTGATALRRCIVLDWESVDIGSGLVDVGWLIPGCVPNLSAEVELRLLRGYHSALVARGVRHYAFDACVADYRRCMLERFVQGVLSGTIWDPDSVSARDAAFATALGTRYAAAAERLALWELL